MTRTVKSADDYMSRVLKHIPSEIVMVYVAVDGVLRTSYNPNVSSERQTLSRLAPLSCPFTLWSFLSFPAPQDKPSGYHLELSRRKTHAKQN